MSASSENPATVRIERVRGRLDDAAAAGLRAFWQARGVLDGGEAEARLPRVLSRLVDGEGRTIGSNSAIPARIPAIAGQWFHVYRGLIAPPFDTPEQWMTMLAAGWDILAEEAGRAAEPHCIGVLVPVVDETVTRAWPQAIWPQTRFLHAGTADNGATLRLRYFDNARIDTEAGHE